MDANKLKALREIGYRVEPCCGICRHGEFRDSGRLFGVCLALRYDHLKHSESRRRLSVCRHGRCSGDSFSLADWFAGEAGAYSEFLTRKA